MEWPGAHQRQRPKEEADNGAIVESKGPRRWSGPAAMARDKRLLRARSRRVRQTAAFQKKKKTEGLDRAHLSAFQPSHQTQTCESLCVARVVFFVLFFSLCVCLRELPSSSVRDEALIK